MIAAAHALRPFTIHADDADLFDLKRRLSQTRWPDSVPDSGWSYGANADFMHELIAYWQAGFDWRAQERELNRFAQFIAEIDGQAIHFIHERSPHANALPLIISHGWPSSVAEMMALIPRLTHPERFGGNAEDAFHVVVPSLPGFGFSPRPNAPAPGTIGVAKLWSQLMADVLGYERFVAHGGDIGAGITTWLGLHHAARVQAIHLTAFVDPYLGEGSAPLTEEEQRYAGYVRSWLDEEGAYAHVQDTRPQTVAFALNDSPAGLAAWIVEKFQAWSDCGGDVERRFSKDQLLTNVTIYWLTQTINSSMRYYHYARRHGRGFLRGERVTVPVGVGLTCEAVDHAPRSWVERSYNVMHWTEFSRGSHFMAAEEPDLLAQDLRCFFRRLR